MSKTVLSQIDAEGNATVLLNRPDVHNAFDPEMVEALTATLKKLDADPKVRAVLLTGAGKSFSAGADIGHMKKSARASRAWNLEDARGIADMLLALCTMKKPTIACVKGAVRGGGLGLVAACDIAIADFTATFRFSEVRLGILPATISPYVIAAIGERVARRYMLSGEEFDCAEAYRIGLLHEICPEAELNGVVGRMLGQLYLGGPAAIAAIKRLIPDVSRSDVGAGLAEKTAGALADLRATAEAQEGLSAFLEKRKASWTEAPAPRKKKRAGKRSR